MGKSETHKEDHEDEKKKVKSDFNEKIGEVKDYIIEFNKLDYKIENEKEGTITSTDNQVQYNGNKNEQGLPHGFGRMVLKDGDTYEGNFVNGVAQGLGNYKDMKAEQTYTGEFDKGEPNGKVVIKKDDNSYTYEGDVISYNAGVTEKRFVTRSFGYGVSLAQGKTYTGEFKDYFTGLTRVIYEDKSTFDGWFAITFVKKFGFGIRKYNNGDVYKGFCIRGEPHGMGVLTKINGGNKIWSKNFKTDDNKNLIEPTDGEENSEMDRILDATIEEIMNTAKIEEVIKKANEAAQKATEKAKEANEKAAQNAIGAQWGLKEYGVASAAVGLGAAGLYYAFSKSKSMNKRKRKSKSKSRRRTKSKSKSKSSE